MSRLWHPWCLVWLIWLVLASSALPAQAQTLSKGSPAKSRVLAAAIDQHLARHWTVAKAAPAPIAGDAEFLRRVSLDLIGRIPSVAETRSFLADKNPERRNRVIEQLLASPRYSTHFANIYRDLLIPEANNNFLVRSQQGRFVAWLKGELAANVPYDRLTRDLLTTAVGQANPFDYIGVNGGPSPIAFYAAKEFRPESLAAGTARIFLGVRVECAQCHNHPFAAWKREQFWSFAAFFSGIQAQKAGDVILPGTESPNKKEILIPGTDKTVEARFLDGFQPNWKSRTPTRTTLAEWVTSPSNPYFARAAVNRTWAYFFGTGLVEPIDEMIGSASTSSHPELLDLLAKEFIQHNFDMKYLIGAITSSQAYQRTSAGKPRGDEKIKRAEATPSFARMSLRGLTPEQLFDSLAMATGYRDGATGDASLLSEILGKRSPRAEFLAKFANQTERAAMAQTSILQALSLMNGTLIADATSLERSETLGALLDAPFLSTTDRIETLYLAALSRRPSTKEFERATRFIDTAVAKAAADGKAYDNAVADVFWALLNSSEFALNH